MCRGAHAATASAKSPAAGQELRSKKREERVGSGRAGGLREQLYLFSLGPSVRLNALCSVM